MFMVAAPIFSHADDNFENADEDDDLEDGTVENSEEDEILVPKVRIVF